MSRTYTDDKDSSYIVPVDAADLARLQKQHKGVRNAFRSVWPFLISDESFSLKEGDRVLDSGTANGEWLLDAVKHYRENATDPTKAEGVQFVGIDISPNGFPAPGEGPPSTSFEKLSILSLPESWTSSFAFVHQRYLCAALRLQQWKEAISEIHRILKPGGYVAFVEPRDIVTGDYGNKFNRYLRAMFAKNGLVMEAAEKLPDLLKEQGFAPEKVGTKMFKYILGASHYPEGSEERQIAIYGRDGLIELFRGMKRPDFANVKDPNDVAGIKSEQEFIGILDGLEMEMDESKGAYLEVMLIYAQK